MAAASTATDSSEAVSQDPVKLERQAFFAGTMAAERLHLLLQAQSLLNLLREMPDLPDATRSRLRTEVDEVLIQLIQLNRTPFTKTASWREYQEQNQDTCRQVLAEIRNLRIEFKLKHPSERTEKAIHKVLDDQDVRAEASGVGAAEPKGKP